MRTVSLSKNEIKHERRKTGQKQEKGQRDHSNFVLLQNYPHKDSTFQCLFLTFPSIVHEHEEENEVITSVKSSERKRELQRKSGPWQRRRRGWKRKKEDGLIERDQKQEKRDEQEVKNERDDGQVNGQLASSPGVDLYQKFFFIPLVVWSDKVFALLLLFLVLLESKEESKERRRRRLRHPFHPKHWFSQNTYTFLFLRIECPLLSLCVV